MCKWGGHLLHANLLQQARARVFVAINACDDKGQSVAYYAQLLLCFTATYLGDTVHLCYVRWLHTASDVARAARRPVSAAETRGPFDAYRWATDGPHILKGGMATQRREAHVMVS